jgi:hypothetical protein
MKNQPQKSDHHFNSVLERSENNLWACHFRVPDRIASKFGDVKSRRVVCVLNNSFTYQTAILAYREGYWVIRVNKSTMKKLKVGFGDEIEVQLSPDESEYGLPMPEELEELLLQDKNGAKYFKALTPGKQRTLLYMVNSVKNKEKRIIRALAIVNHLKVHKGAIDYKQLNQEIRNQK